MSLKGTRVCLTYSMIRGRMSSVLKAIMFQCYLYNLNSILNYQTLKIKRYLRDIQNRRVKHLNGKSLCACVSYRKGHDLARSDLYVNSH